MAKMKKSCEGEHPYESQSRLQRAGLWREYRRFTDELKKKGMTPMEAYYKAMEDERFQIARTDEIIAFKIAAGRLDKNGRRIKRD